MSWFLSPRLSIGDLIALTAVNGVNAEHGLLPACGAAVGAGLALSAGRYLARVD